MAGKWLVSVLLAAAAAVVAAGEASPDGYDAQPVLMPDGSLELPDIRARIVRQLEQARRAGTAEVVGPDAGERAFREAVVPAGPEPPPASPPEPPPVPRGGGGYVPLPSKVITIRSTGDLELLEQELDQARQRHQDGTSERP